MVNHYITIKWPQITFPFDTTCDLVLYERSMEIESLNHRNSQQLCNLLWGPQAWSYNSLAVDHRFIIACTASYMNPDNHGCSSLALGYNHGNYDRIRQLKNPALVTSFQEGPMIPGLNSNRQRRGRVMAQAIPSSWRVVNTSSWCAGWQTLGTSRSVWHVPGFLLKWLCPEENQQVSGKTFVNRIEAQVVWSGTGRGHKKRAQIPVYICYIGLWLSFHFWSTIDCWETKQVVRFVQKLYFQQIEVVVPDWMGWLLKCLFLNHEPGNHQFLKLNGIFQIEWFPCS